MQADQKLVVTWRRRKRVGVLLAVYAGLALFSGFGLFASGGGSGSPDHWRVLVGAALILSAVISGPISAINGRCPSCGTFLGKVMMFGNACPRCRTEFE